MNEISPIVPTTAKDWASDQEVRWCPGCGDYAVLSSLQKACADLGLAPEEVVLVSGIGCSGKIAQHFGSYGFHSLHGRALPTATGVNTRLVSACPDGQGAGAGASSSPRRTSKTASQVRQR